MTIPIINIGNSKGIRIPQAIIKQYNLQGRNLELTTHADCIILKPIANTPRQNWQNELAQIQVNGHDALLIPDFFDDETHPTWN